MKIRQKFVYVFELDALYFGEIHHERNITKKLRFYRYEQLLWFDLSYHWYIEIERNLLQICFILKTLFSSHIKFNYKNNWILFLWFSVFMCLIRIRLVQYDEFFFTREFHIYLDISVS